MTSPKRHIDQTEEILTVAESFGKAVPSPFLEAKILRRLETEMNPAPAPVWGRVPVSLRLGGIAALLLLNLFTYLYLRNNGESTTEQETIAQTYWNYEELIIQ